MTRLNPRLALLALALATTISAKALAADPPPLTVYKSGPIALVTGAPIPVVAGAGKDDVTGLAIVPFTLVEKTSEQPLGHEAIRLVAYCGKNKLCPTVTIPKNTTRVLYIKGANASGHYAGSIQLTANGGVSATTSDFAIDLSTWGEQALGALLLFLGVVISTLGLRLLGNDYARKTALFQAAVARQRIKTLRDKLAEKCPHFPSPLTKDQLTWLEQALTPSALQANGLGALLGMPTLGTGQDNAKLGQYMTGILVQIAAEETIVRSGLEVLAAQYDEADEAGRKQLLDAAKKLDALHHPHAHNQPGYAADQDRRHSPGPAGAAADDRSDAGPDRQAPAGAEDARAISGRDAPDVVRHLADRDRRHLAVGLLCLLLVFGGQRLFARQ
jgi:hypothetical protein